jgi:hypothetical protein
MGFERLLARLASAEVDFVVVGGVGAVLHGVPTTTFDLGIVHSRDEANRLRLFGVLEELEACYRQHLPRVLLPTMKDLDSDGHMLLMTIDGPLDVLGRVTGGHGYEELLAHSKPLVLESGTSVQVLDLEMLIRIKEETGREKDLAQLPLLRRTLEQRGS